MSGPSDLFPGPAFPREDRILSVPRPDGAPGAVGHNLTEAELVRAVRDGDRRAFRTLVHSHEKHLYAFGLRLMGDETDAMDLLQDVFIEAWKSVRRFRGDSTISTWLHGIAVKKAQERWRSAKRRLKRESMFARDVHISAIRAAMPEARIDLERAILSLAPRMRAVVILYYIEGRPQREVAEIMGIAEGTVKAHAHNARKLLKERLSR